MIRRRRVVNRKKRCGEMGDEGGRGEEISQAT